MQNWEIDISTFNHFIDTLQEMGITGDKSLRIDRKLILKEDNYDLPSGNTTGRELINEGCYFVGWGYPL